MDRWQTIEHGVWQRLQTLSEKLIHPCVRGGGSVGRFWSSKQATGTTDLTYIFADAESVPPVAASDAIEEGRLVLRFTSSVDATLTVTESDESGYLCCYEPPSAWLSRSSPEIAYYRFADRSWLDLADTLVPLFALGWELDNTTTSGKRRRHLPCDGQSRNERSPRSGEEDEQRV